MPFTHKADVFSSFKRIFAEEEMVIVAFTWVGANDAMDVSSFTTELAKEEMVTVAFTRVIAKDAMDVSFFIQVFAKEEMVTVCFYKGHRKRCNGRFLSYKGLRKRGSVIVALTKVFAKEEMVIVAFTAVIARKEMVIVTFTRIIAKEEKRQKKKRTGLRSKQSRPSDPSAAPIVFSQVVLLQGHTRRLRFEPGLFTNAGCFTGRQQGAIPAGALSRKPGKQ